MDVVKEDAPEIEGWQVGVEEGEGAESVVVGPSVGGSVAGVDGLLVVGGCECHGVCVCGRLFGDAVADGYVSSADGGTNGAKSACLYEVGLSEISE